VDGRDRGSGGGGGERERVREIKQRAQGRETERRKGGREEGRETERWEERGGRREVGGERDLRRCWGRFEME
jgi:hypothetical protein